MISIVTLRIYSRILAPTDITVTLGVTPTRTVGKGDPFSLRNPDGRRREWTTWSRKTQITSDNIGDHFATVLPWFTDLSSVKQKDPELEVALSIMAYATPLGFRMSFVPEQVTILASHNCGIGLDVYGGGDEDEDDNSDGAELNVNTDIDQGKEEISPELPEEGFSEESRIIKVSLVVQSGVLETADVTTSLGASPTDTVAKGVPSSREPDSSYREWAAWSRESLVTSEDLDEHFTALLPYISKLSSLRVKDPNLSAHLSVMLFDGSTGFMVDLTGEQMAVLAAHGCGVTFDCYEKPKKMLDGSGNSDADEPE